MNPNQGKGSGTDKGAYIRLFTDFYASDIILASPLGLRLVIEAGKGYKIILHFINFFNTDNIHKIKLFY